MLTMLSSGGLNETTCDPVDKATRISLIYTSLISNLLTLIGCWDLLELHDISPTFDQLRVIFLYQTQVKMCQTHLFRLPDLRGWLLAHQTPEGMWKRINVFLAADLCMCR